MKFLIFALLVGVATAATVEKRDLAASPPGVSYGAVPSAPGPEYAEPAPAFYAARVPQVQNIYREPGYTVQQGYEGFIAPVPGFSSPGFLGGLLAPGGPLPTLLMVGAGIIITIILIQFLGQVLENRIGSGDEDPEASDDGRGFSTQNMIQLANFVMKSIEKYNELNDQQE